uniref:Formamidopyrimidine-DNA glycosylase catalytic domain-containing protein n=1 Tax=viral metagenome TaxID=1070528 RepID=A0A6C0EBE3_9ZZZZ
MPEGAEVRYLAELAKKYMVGHKFEHIVSNTKAVVKLPNPSKVVDVGSKGKIMWIETVDYILFIHYGLTGWLLLENSKYPKYVFKFDNFDAFIDDSRRFSKLHVLKDKTKKVRFLSNLGVDILSKDFTYNYMKNILRKRNANICSVLMEQSLFAGIGNYIKNESLYIAKISPYRRCNELSDKEIIKLYGAIRYVTYSNLAEMMRMIKRKLPVDLRNISPKQISVPYKFKVYGNDYDPLGNKVTIENVNGRATYYVKKIQK